MEGRLPFLDVLVTRQHNGALTTTIYHKPTHTNRYVQFTSHHPRHHKLSVAHSLHNRLNTHITDHTDYCVQSSHVEQTLALNGYPRKYFRGQRKITDRTLPTRSFESFTSIPYVQCVSDKIQRVLNEVGVKVAVKPHLTIRKLFPSLKDPLDNSEKSCLVYQIPCRDCSFVYIGKTKHDQKSKLDEHKRAIKNQRPEQSNINAQIFQSLVSILSLWTTHILDRSQNSLTGNRLPETTILRKLAYKSKIACHDPKRWQFIPCSLFRFT